MHSCFAGTGYFERIQASAAGSLRSSAGGKESRTGMARAGRKRRAARFCPFFMDMGICNPDPLRDKGLFESELRQNAEGRGSNADGLGMPGSFAPFFHQQGIDLFLSQQVASKRPTGPAPTIRICVRITISIHEKTAGTEDSFFQPRRCSGFLIDL